MKYLGIVTIIASLFITSAARADVQQPVRILSVQDPFAYAIEDILTDLENELGLAIEIDFLPYDAIPKLLLLDSFRATPKYDIISVDTGWIPELASTGIHWHINPH